ncbi:hypothetical protein B0T22DRAFT_467275 [Podospora appendiculata]|uniref:Uncharacterized protein n=1 Tax=Podospora appendiculata TaxID=314037 RepID=A0AAE1CB11_9PEZI|nr:hypothetical protein B0T22DRAFT_467275 [Podospora appendiculata]
MSRPRPVTGVLVQMPPQRRPACIHDNHKRQKGRRKEGKEAQTPDQRRHCGQIPQQTGQSFITGVASDCVETCSTAVLALLELLPPQIAREGDRVHRSSSHLAEDAAAWHQHEQSSSTLRIPPRHSESAAAAADLQVPEHKTQHAILTARVLLSLYQAQRLPLNIRWPSAQVKPTWKRARRLTRIVPISNPYIRYRSTYLRYLGALRLMSNHQPALPLWWMSRKCDYRASRHIITNRQKRKEKRHPSPIRRRLSGSCHLSSQCESKRNTYQHVPKPNLEAGRIAWLPSHHPVVWCSSMT